jgi:hypothetical protein
MLALEINNQEIESIFLDGFNSDKELFLNFIKNSYNKMILLNSFDKSIKQAQLQENNELDEISLTGLINELKNSTNS